MLIEKQLKCNYETLDLWFLNSQKMDFWHERLWLPGNITWGDIERFEAAGNEISKARDLYVVPIIAVLLLGVR